MKLIKINPEHYVIVDDSEIKEGDWCLMFDDYGNLFLGNQPQQYLGEQAGHHLNKGLKKVTHSTQPLEAPVAINGFENYAFISLSEVKELIGEVDSLKKLKDIALDKSCSPSDWEYIYGYMLLGYNQALEDNKEKKYTEEDVIEFAIWRNITVFDPEKALTPKGQFELWKSLQPKTEWEVEFVDGKLKLKS